MHRFTGAQVHWCTCSMVHWCTCSMVHWFTLCTCALVHFVHWCTGSLCAPVHWFTDALVHRFTGTLVHLVQWFTGALVHWCTGSLVHWFTGSLVHWCTGSLGAFDGNSASLQHRPPSLKALCLSYTWHDLGYCDTGAAHSGYNHELVDPIPTCSRSLRYLVSPTPPPYPLSTTMVSLSQGLPVYFL